ncbi:MULTISPECIES: TetR/AcrR family transcriptional regulator [Pseudomonas]|uniref:TetR/AcrR family transcriptional regulator n=1 Tax=Pseudomonas TaxID=286 RepID=UPI0025800A0C|nr:MULTISPECIES: TetR/AcrR family transcriptional regulator [Pseudomonas]
MTTLEEGPVSAPLTRGRRRDPGRDEAILDATIEVLAESGYDGMTMDMVAARAKTGKATVYRRWSSKAELILEAVTHLKRSQVDLDRLPDTGTLRGDLLALFKPQSVEEAHLKMRVMAGLASVLLQNPQLGEAGDAAIVQPWAVVNRLLMQRALERGEISPKADINALSQVLPSMAAYRALIQKKPFDLEFLTALVDGVLLPALLK